jgi:gas vesicle structural protein
MSHTSSVTRRPASGSLAEVVDLILDKGLVVDAYVRVSVVGIELVTIDVRVVIASVDTYLHFAEATNRLDLRGQAEEYDTDLVGVTELARGKGAAADYARGAARGGAQAIKSAFTGDR